MVLPLWLFACGGDSSPRAAVPAPIVALGAADASPSMAATDSGGDAGSISDAGGIAAVPGDSAVPAPKECDWVDLAQPAMKSFRTNARRLLDDHAPGEKPREITCCALSDVDALCRARSYKTPSPREYRYAVYTRLVGVNAQKSEPWFDAPVEVADYKTLKQVNPPWDLELALTKLGLGFMLRVTTGKCPRACVSAAGGCKRWEVQANRACTAAGTYEVSNGVLERL